jgi:hypothetical protein
MVVKQAIVPRLSVNQAIEDWEQTQKYLAENSRKRHLQTDRLCDIL